jgi:hypothetical protein
VGRTARTVNRAQRRALRAMHRTWPTPTATSRSATPRSTTSAGGYAIAARPTSTTSCRSANGTTAASTKAAGASP